jgi:2-keto-4-pentenoate hydratase/2-oxohepta-3-ene-1,7-dioic acid hydratase in catechol pathway
MIFNAYEQIAYLSTLLALKPGDVIATGTPAGVGIGFDPPRYLARGDQVTIEIDGLGRLSNAIQ